MPAFTSALADHLHDHYGYTTTEWLRTLGLTDHQREALVADGLLVPFLRGVYRARSTPDSLEGRCLGICLADDRAVITGRAGGRLWGVRRMGSSPLIEVRVPHFANTLSHPDVVVRRCNLLDPIDVVVRADGIRVVSPPRLAFDLAHPLDDIDLESVIEQIIDHKWCTAQTLHDTAQRLYHPARPGSTRFVRVLGRRPIWMKPADSHLEVVLFDALRRAGLKGMERQVRIDLPGGWAIHADIAVRAWKWAIPIDHVTWHGGRFDSQRDKENDRQAAMIGWQVNRVTDDDIDGRLAQVVDELMSIAAQLSARPR
jgi:very-short-patch-repair endonuclease